jgi:dipeptidyl aminopeptidase/acylaminoacyl peptidase
MSPRRWAAARSPGRNGEILFMSLRIRNGHHHLYVMRPDGTHKRPVTGPAANVAGPTWSPDGKWIAYLRSETRKNSCSQLYVMRANGTRARRLTHDRWCYDAPAWSPDGRRLAFPRHRGVGKFSICSRQAGVTNLDGWRSHPDPAWTVALAGVVGCWSDRKTVGIESTRQPDPRAPPAGGWYPAAGSIVVGVPPGSACASDEHPAPLSARTLEAEAAQRAFGLG